MFFYTYTYKETWTIDGKESEYSQDIQTTEEYYFNKTLVDWQGMARGWSDYSLTSTPNTLTLTFSKGNIIYKRILVKEEE